jgi:hypothetical protein
MTKVMMAMNEPGMVVMVDPWNKVVVEGKWMVSMECK